ncbi:MAG: bifunctional phosphopantothenoylcysteine decarboxylase/phosphopantothenate--cysteine ligase CoaBC [Syntrophobacterales bacterium]|nr:bifunctional phosphopantothenoylcysteine decarboxylase/phosphopantothenate--cysteine ligase CoaBC [Syntrophobacterales bacterium]
MLKGKKILLGITGGIAAYKSAELTREFIKAGAEVKVVMTANAGRFITPLTLQVLSGNPVYSDMFALTADRGISHISLADYPDVIVIAPATANLIGKVAAGLADDLLSTTVMASRKPVLFCPAMNVNMYQNEVVRHNMAMLSGRGYHILEASEGEMACGSEGPGRLPPLVDICEAVESILTEKDLEGENILVTAGPTQEPLDPVRFISNHSSGKMGYALAVMAKRRGAKVTLISGPTNLPSPSGVEFVSVGSAVEMRDAVIDCMKEATVIIKAAAVADYRPARLSASKIKKKEGTFTLELERNPDIIAEVGHVKGNRILIGFAMETENLVENARAKLISKNMDLIVANDLSSPEAGFQADTNIVKLIDREGRIESLPLLDKKEVADRILSRIKPLRARTEK